MSTSLLLPCSPPPHRNSPADRPVASLGHRAPPLLSFGSFSSYTGCPGANKTPLLKGRRPSAQPSILARSPSETNLSFAPVAVGIHLRESSPARRVLLPLENCSQPSVRESAPLNRRLLYSEEGFYPPEEPLPTQRKPFLVTSKVAPLKSSLSDSSSSLTSLSPRSPTGPTFPRRFPCPQSPPRTQLRKSQSALIMPNLLTLLRPEPVVPVGPAPSSPLPEDSNPGPKDCNDSGLPSPLLRKCHTMVSLSNSSNSIGSTHQPTTTKVVTGKEKTSRFGFLRRISSSKSAVFSPSPSSKSSGLRKSPSAALHRYRKTSLSGAHPSPDCHDSRATLNEDDREGDVFDPYPSREEEGDRVTWVPSGGGCSRCTSSASLPSRRQSTVMNDALFCKLCLSDVSVREIYQLQQCQCRFCTYCMGMYATLKIREGEPVIECPDSNCDCRGELTVEEVESLVGKELLNLHLRFKRDREIDSDPLKTWCPKPGCDTVVCLAVSKLDGRPQCCSCPICNTLFCGSCSSPWHPGKPCNHIVAQLLGVPLNDAIKRCPRCKVPIERDAGCAQMQCKKCKHVFCWYCLASLEDDFLLRHYDKGPCKNKLGHSRASVLWHRAQVVVIFAGFGLLLVIASPLLLFVGPCLLCRSCRPCTSGSSSRHDSAEEGDSGM